MYCIQIVNSKWITIATVPSTSLLGIVRWEIMTITIPNQMYMMDYTVWIAFHWFAIASYAFTTVPTTRYGVVWWVLLIAV